MRSWLRTSLIVLTTASDLRAQRADTATVPRELAVALIAFNNFGESRPAIVVGRVPAQFMAPLVPASATILGGVNEAGPMEDANMSQLILTMAVSPDSARMVLGAHLAASGWRKVEMPGEDRAMSLGPIPKYPMFFYCSDDASLYGSAIPFNGGALLRISATPSLDRTMCDPKVRGIFNHDEQPDPYEALPKLKPPAGIPSLQFGRSSSDRDVSMRTIMRSDTQPAELLAFFATQLVAQGWTLAESVKGRDVALQTATKNNERGERMLLTLIDTRRGTKDHNLLSELSTAPRANP